MSIHNTLAMLAVAAAVFVLGMVTAVLCQFKWFWWLGRSGKRLMALSALFAAVVSLTFAVTDKHPLPYDWVPKVLRK
jgi:uncharacterized membrane protein YedE/YeeE